MASHSSFSLKLHVIRNIITAPYSSPKTLFSLLRQYFGGAGRRSGGGTEHTLVASGEVSEESCQEVGIEIQTTFVGLRDALKFKKFRGPSERQKTSTKTLY